MEPRPTSEAMFDIKSSATIAPSSGTEKSTSPALIDAEPTTVQEIGHDNLETGVVWLLPQEFENEDGAVMQPILPLDAPSEQLPGVQTQERSEINLKRDQQTATLWQSGQSPADIAAKLGTSPSTIYETLRYLRDTGVIPDEEYRKRDGRRLRRLKTQERDAEIARRCRQGETTEEIATALHYAQSTVADALSRLLRQGGLTADERHAAYVHVRNWQQRAKTLIPILQEDTSLKEAGSKLGVTTERVRQLRRRVIKSHGEEALKTSEQRYSVPEVCTLLGVKQDWLRRYINAGNLGKVMRRGKKEYRLTVEQVEQLRSHNDELQQRVERTTVCKHCNQTFTYLAITKRMRTARTREYCSGACKTAHRLQPRDVDSTARLSPAIRLLQERLATHPIPENEQWIPLSQAIRLTNLPHIRLIHLVRTRVLLTKPDEDRQWRGRPVQLFATSQLNIVRTVLDELKGNTETAETSEETYQAMDELDNQSI